MAVPVISVAQMRAWEKAAWSTGQSEQEVIRRVGSALAQFSLKLTRPGDSILILAGKGHNGDDARYAREHLTDRRVEILEIKDPEAEFQELEARLSLGPALVIDGLFGIGINRALNGHWLKLIDRINAAGRQILSVDVPSGLNGDTGQPQGGAIQASVTLTVGAPKRGLLEPASWPYVGRLEAAVDIGLGNCPHQSDLQWTLPEDFCGYPQTRPVASHKGDFGHLALICGSVGYHGAAVLAARGAQRARPGLISLYTHLPVYETVAAQLQAVMVHPWSTEWTLPGKCSAVLIGPGLAARDLPEDIRERTRQLWREFEFPVIVDASALEWVMAERPAKNSIRVVTPHPGEAARILNTTSANIQADRPSALRKISEQLGNCWVVLKGHQTLVGRSQGPIYVNSSGNPYLAQGGAGDLLGGFIAGLLAQPPIQKDALLAIRSAVWRHGAAADRLQTARQNWTVEDLAQEIGAQ